MNAIEKLSMKDLRERLDAIVAKMNRRQQLGMTSDWQFGEMLTLELKATELGNEIRRRKIAS